jgi:hypothetical protein
VFAVPVPGNCAGMTDETSRTDRNPTDEPDGTTAMAASLRQPGDSLRQSAGETPGGDDTFAEAEGSADAPPESRAGYDPGAVSGGSEDYRPDA